MFEKHDIVCDKGKSLFRTVITGEVHRVISVASVRRRRGSGYPETKAAFSSVLLSLTREGTTQQSGIIPVGHRTSPHYTISL